MPTATTYETCQTCGAELVDVRGELWRRAHLNGRRVLMPHRDCPHIVECAEADCSSRFVYVAARQSPTLCLEHSEAADRARYGWTPNNSTD